jgi:leucyl/phenylalanyl-tRNA---protein transferase
MWGTSWRLIREAFSALFESAWRPSPFVIPRLDSRPDVFPEPRTASPHGLLAVGGELTVPRLLAAYRRGIFPYYESGPVLWWSPEPRAVIELDGLHVSRRLARTIRSGKFAVTFDTDFDAVIRGCAQRLEGTWITADIIRAYSELHRAGHAHSVEVWRQGELAGGLYGVTIGGLFAGESMFSGISDASKVALVHLVERLKRRGYVLLDVQILNDHTQSMGAIEIPRDVYLDRLADAVGREVTFREEELNHG